MLILQLMGTAKAAMWLALLVLGFIWGSSFALEEKPDMAVVAYLGSRKVV